MPCDWRKPLPATRNWATICCCFAEAMIADLRDARAYKRPIVTRLEPLTAFYPAEAKHQDYVACHLQNPYVQAVAMPKVAKVREKFKDLLKSSQEAAAGH